MSEYKRKISAKLGEILIEMGTITRKQLDEALARQATDGGLIGEVLVKLNHAKEEDIVQAFTVQYGIPYLPLEHYQIDETVLRLIPASIVREYHLIAIDRIDNTLTIAMSNPLNNAIFDELRRITGCEIETFVCTHSDISQIIREFYRD